MIVLMRTRAEVNINEYKLKTNNACKKNVGKLKLNPNNNIDINSMKLLLKCLVKNISILAINMSGSSSNEFVL